jgi:DNA-binding NarL/FixJ family response regulator
MAAIRLVLVEDNRLFRQTMELLLGLRGEIELVGSVESGAQAIAVCTELAPDVVVMDYRMPGLDGAQTTAAVLRACPNARVICLTASVSPEERELVLAAGAVACITKLENLDTIIDAILELGQAAA